MMMGATGDPGKAMGSWLVNAPGARTSEADAIRLGNQTPTGATVDRTQRRVVFTTTDVHLTALASPAGGPDETFRIAGLVNPTLVVPVGATVSIQVINTDPDTAHGLVIADPGAASSWMPMMTAAPAFPGGAVWALGDPTSAGMHTATLTFTATSSGTYAYLCAVPGHAQKGMVGSFLVSDSTS
jgi:rusticyanin